MAAEPPARVITLAAAASGLGVVALVVTFLFSLYGSFQRREISVVALQAAAGAPPSAIALLETYAQLDLVRRLPELFDDWEHWAAEVLDTWLERKKARSGNATCAPQLARTTTEMG